MVGESMKLYPSNAKKVWFKDITGEWKFRETNRKERRRLRLYGDRVCPGKPEDLKDTVNHN